MKPILKIITEWMSLLREAGIEPTTNLVRACVKKHLIDSGQHDRLIELDLRYPSEEVIGRMTHNFLIENGLIDG